MSEWPITSIPISRGSESLSGMTIVFLYFASHVLFALEKSRKFRARSGSAGTGVSFLSILVGVMVVTQTARLAINVSMAWISSNHYHNQEEIIKCIENFSLADSAEHVAWKCIEEYQFTDYLMYCSFIEFTFVFLYTACKKLSVCRVCKENGQERERRREP